MIKKARKGTNVYAGELFLIIIRIMFLNFSSMHAYLAKGIWSTVISFQTCFVMLNATSAFLSKY